jgi:hypothetical protein
LTEPGVGTTASASARRLQGDAAYLGMEVQVLDDAAPQYKDLLPAQYCGSVYKVSPVRRGALKPRASGNANRRSPRSGATST